MLLAATAAYAEVPRRGQGSTCATAATMLDDQPTEPQEKSPTSTLKEELLHFSKWFSDLLWNHYLYSEVNYGGII